MDETYSPIEHPRLSSFIFFVVHINKKLGKYDVKHEVGPLKLKEINNLIISPLTAHPLTSGENGGQFP